MATSMISQLQESFPLRRAAGCFEISFTKCLRGAKTVQLPVTFSVSCQIVADVNIDTFFSELEDLCERFAEVSENNVEKLIEGGENANSEKKNVRQN